jgi:hypothetical protein
VFSTYVFSESGPSSVTTIASSNPVGGVLNYPAGVAAPLDDCAGLDIIATISAPASGSLAVFVQAGLADGTWVDVVAFDPVDAGDTVTYKTNIGSVAITTDGAPTAIGTGLSPALTPPQTVQGLGFDRVRLVMTGGSGTDAAGSVEVYMTAQRPYAGPWQR